MSRDTNEDTLYDAAHDAFMQFWHAAGTDEAVHYGWRFVRLRSG
jgi:hypothetical protein